MNNQKNINFIASEIRENRIAHEILSRELQKELKIFEVEKNRDKEVESYKGVMDTIKWKKLKVPVDKNPFPNEEEEKW